MNNNWAKSVTMQHKKMLPPGFIPGRSIRITFDNSDGKQQTLTGSHTTHHTTCTIFQAVYPYDAKSTPKANEKTDIVDQEKPVYESIKIPKKRAYPIISTMSVRTGVFLHDALERNIAWVLVSAIGNDCLEQCFPDVDKKQLGPVGS